MKSIKILLFGCMPIFASASLLIGEIRQSTIATTNWQDLTVNGRGYIETVDERFENRIWLRAVQLGLNQSGQLCACLKGEFRPIEPTIHIPSDWTKLSIDKDGSVLVKHAGQIESLVGSIHLTMFLGDVNDAIVTENDVENRIGPPMQCEPGHHGAGHLDQYVSKQYCLPLTVRSILLATTLGCTACFLAFSQGTKLP